MSRYVGMNPFVGPKPISSGEPLFGRDREVRDLLNHLVPERIVLMYSPSGAGKTSLIQAGLLPELCQQGFVDFPIARVGQVSPHDFEASNRYVASLLLSFEDAFLMRPFHIEELVSLDIKTYLDLRHREIGETSSLFLALDQFEEVLTLDPTDIDKKKEFFYQLGQSLDHPRRWALFSMREDYVAALDPYLRLLPTRLRTRYRLELLSTRGARAAFQEPARLAGCSISDAAAEELVNDLRRLQVQSTDGQLFETLGPTVEPVQLQVVCRRWWREEGIGSKRIETWRPESGGDVDSVLRDYYEESLLEAIVVADYSERTLRRWIQDNLLSPDGLRRQVLLADAAKIVPDNVRELLIRSHLVRHERRRGVSWLELAHDRLVTPIHVSNLDWFEENQTPLERHAALWAREGRRDDLLLRGKALSEALEVLNMPSLEQSELCLELLKRSKERSLRWRWRVLLISIPMLIGLLVTVGFQNFKVNAAFAKARSREMASFSLMNAESEPGLATLLALESGLRSNDSNIQDALLSVFEVFPRLEKELWSPGEKSETLSFGGEENALYIGSSGRVVAWNVSDWTPIPVLDLGAGQTPWMTLFDFSGELAAVLLADGWVEVRVVETGQRQARFRIPEDFEIHCLAFSPDGQGLLFGGASREENWMEVRDGEILLWSLNEATPSVRWRGLERSVATSISFDSLGLRAAIGFSNGTIQVRALDSGELLAEDRQHKAAINSILFQPETLNIISASEDWAVRFWDLTSPGSNFLMRHDAGVTTLAIDTRGQYLVSGSRDATVKLWDLYHSRQLAKLEGHRSPISVAAFDKEGSRVATASHDGRVLVWQVDDPHPPIGGLRTETSTLKFDSKGEHLSMVDQQGRIETWKVDDRSLEHPLHSPLGLRGRHAFLKSRPAEDLIAISSVDRKESSMTIADLNPGISTIELFHPSRVGADSIARSFQTAWVFTATEDGVFYRWDATTGELLESLEQAHKAAICALAASPVDDLLISADVDGLLRLWEVDPFNELPVHGRDVRAHGIDLCRLAVDPKGKVLATADITGTLSFWDLSRRGLMLRIRIPEALSDRYDNTISSLAFDREGKLLAVGGYKEIQLWDVDRHRQIGPPLRAHQNRVTDLAFSPTEPLLASSSADRVVLWNFDMEYWRRRACRLANRNLSQSEWRQYVGEDEPYRVQCPGYPVPED